MLHIAETLNKFADLLEYTSGATGKLVKYITRTGTPGNYSYVYPSDKVSKLSRTKYKVLQRWIHKHSQFLKKIQTSYRGSRFHMKTLSWGYQMATISTQQGSQFKMFINLKTHKIKSYKGKLKGPSASAELNKLRKQGILRYR